MSDSPVTVEQHLRRILDDTSPSPAVTVPLLDALGLVCATEVVSPLSLPRFDNSAMDGYAVLAADVASATETAPVTLPVIGEIGAGQVGVSVIAPGQVAKIMTGAPVPEGCDAVVPYEWTDAGATDVVITQAPRAGQHIRSAGKDLQTGDVLVRVGDELGPRQLGLLASVGIGEVDCRPRPRVAILSTGSELRNPGEPLGDSEIYDGNSFLLAAAATRAGAIAQRVGIVADDPERFLERLTEVAAEADVVVTSGGVSMGDFDVVKAVLRERGVWFGPVAMQPGKPQGHGRFEGTPIFTLPGNPVSSFISFELFVRPAVRTMMGYADLHRRQVTARVLTGVESPPERRQFLRGVARPPAEDAAAGAGWEVEPMVMPGSHLVGDLSQANCLVVIPEAAASIAAGDEVSIVLLDRSEGEV